MRIYLTTLVAFTLLAITPGAATSETQKAVAEVNDIKVRYKVVLPPDYDPATKYPTLLVFPGGDQSARLRDAGLSGYWTAEAEARGYIVIAPQARRGRLYFQRGSEVFPEFLDQVIETYAIDPDQIHVAGISNGGFSAFHIAAKMPGRFKSVMGLPGQFPNAREELTEENVPPLRQACYTMYVGSRDTSWVTPMQAQADFLRTIGFRISVVVEEGEGHVMGSIAGSGARRLFDRFEDADACPDLSAG